MRVVHSKNFNVESAIEALKTALEGSAVIVLHAALYRMDGRQTRPPLPSIPLPDDLWVPHLCDLAARSVAIAKSQKFYLLLDTGESSPQRPENYERTKAVDGCGVFGMYKQHDGGETERRKVCELEIIGRQRAIGFRICVDRYFANLDGLAEIVPQALVDGICGSKRRDLAPVA